MAYLTNVHDVLVLFSHSQQHTVISAHHHIGIVTGIADTILPWYISVNEDLIQSIEDVFCSANITNRHC